MHRYNLNRIFDLSLMTAGLALVLTAACGDDVSATDADSGIDQPDSQPDSRDTIALPGATLYPEGIAATADGTFYVSSLREGSILRIAPDATAPDPAAFVTAAEGGLVSTIGLLADEGAGVLWSCSSDPGVAPRTGEDPPAIKAFDLASGALQATYDLPGGGFCNDMALDDAGNLYVTDSFAARMLVLPAGASQLEVWLEDEAFAGEGFNLNGVAVVGNEVFTVKYNSGELFRISIESDGSAAPPARVTLDRALEYPDGLKAEGADALLVVEGAGRLARIALQPGDVGAITTVRDGLLGPTTVAVLGSDAWVVEGQLGHLFDPSTGDPELPFQVVRVPLE